MKRVDPNIFDSMAVEYDNWFDRHSILFQNELEAVKKAIPAEGIGVEIGVGTGRFADALKIPVGVEPSITMAQLAIARGITVIKSKAEALPFHNQSFGFAVMITTVCFLDDISKAFAEIHRIIKKDGFFIVAIIDRESEIRKQYAAKKATSHWYKHARFFSVNEITNLLQEAGFTGFNYWQTLFNDTTAITAPLPGFGKGSFVVIRSQKI